MEKWYSGSDYAGVKTPNFEAYYGYEQTTEADGEGEWCFVAKFNGQKKIIPCSKLPKSWRGDLDEFNCLECLVAGLTTVLEELVNARS